MIDVFDNHEADEHEKPKQIKSNVIWINDKDEKGFFCVGILSIETVQCGVEKGQFDCLVVLVCQCVKSHCCESHFPSTSPSPASSHAH